MSDEMDLSVRGYLPGTSVTLIEEQRRATVNCVAIYAHGVLYEVIYWRDGERKIAWVNGRELSSNEPKKRIGLKVD